MISHGVYAEVLPNMKHIVYIIITSYPERLVLVHRCLHHDLCDVQIYHIGADPELLLEGAPTLRGRLPI